MSTVEKVNKDEAEENSNTSVYSHVSPFSAVEKVNEDVPKAEENSNTSVYSWHSCVSTLNTVQEADAPRQEQEDINVALKYVAKEECYESERLGLFGKSLPNEVAMMIQVSKGPSVPQIIKLLDWYETRKEYILVIERPTPCKDLRKYLVQNDGRISESKARAVMHQVVTAERICFERGVFHSDIKLENLLINENSLQVKLIDFGVSRSLKTFGYTRYNGTKLYAPPEAFHRRWRYHAKPATVYSLGVLLFVLLFGKYPYKVKPEALANILKEAEISKGI
ncbi:serine/threonine-protein kinase pim-3-like [Ctenopharyngodon idella]|uniref:serine/threonine-protein kinase pim-3-like n=1 Tax=Ctenopharyngodon idella TaxID=7959 RepID=UPI0022323A0D|nr:serine/threonine-protein kinase pim-3-like [Ctenopharyngodon idella]